MNRRCSWTPEVAVAIAADTDRPSRAYTARAARAPLFVMVAEASSPVVRNTDSTVAGTVAVADTAAADNCIAATAADIAAVVGRKFVDRWNKRELPAGA